MKKYLLNSLAVLLVVVIVAGITYTPALAKDQPPIKVGVIYTLSGGGAGYGVPALKGHDVAREEINRAGGILGRRIESIVRDNKTNSVEATRVARELVMREKVDFLIGTNFTPAGVAIAEVAKEHKVIFMDGAVCSAQFTEAAENRYLFTVAADDVYQGGAMAVMESKTPYKKYWAIGWDYAYCHSLYDSFVKKLKQVKPDAEIVGASWMKIGETELTPYITTILSSKADAVFGMLMSVSVPAFFKQGVAYDLFKKLHVINDIFAGNPEFLRPAGKDCPDGVVLSTWYSPDYPDTPLNKKWTEQYLNMTGEAYVPAGAVQGYISSMVLFKAIAKAGTTDTEKVIKTLENTAFDTPRASGITFRKWDHKSTLGELWGETKYDPALGYGKLVNMRYISPEGLSHSEEEVKAIRAKTKP